MSLLLKDRVYTMQASTAKRGVYPMHGYKLGLYRMPIKLDDPAEIKSILEGMKKTFDMDQYADRIYATYNWIEENMPDPDADGYESIDLSVTVEIVTGEVIDAIYQIYPVEKFAAPQWVRNYRKKAPSATQMSKSTETNSPQTPMTLLSAPTRPQVLRSFPVLVLNTGEGSILSL